MCYDSNHWNFVLGPSHLCNTIAQSSWEGISWNFRDTWWYQRVLTTSPFLFWINTDYNVRLWDCSLPVFSTSWSHTWVPFELCAIASQRMRLGGLGTVALQLAFGLLLCCLIIIFFIGFKWKLGELGLRLFNQPFISLIYHINVIKITGISKKKKK
jgi:hypothetical protein